MLMLGSMLENKWWSSRKLIGEEALTPKGVCRLEEWHDKDALMVESTLQVKSIDACLNNVALRGGRRGRKQWSCLTKNLRYCLHQHHHRFRVEVQGKGRVALNHEGEGKGARVKDIFVHSLFLWGVGTNYFSLFTSTFILVFWKLVLRTWVEFFWSQAA